MHAEEYSNHTIASIFDELNCAGQAVVQFASHQYNKKEFAVKFFLSHSAFQQEMAQYTDSDNPLRRFLPPVHALVDNSNCTHVDGNGHPMPSCIIMEKGESLDLWMKRSRQHMDTFTCMQVRTQTRQLFHTQSNCVNKCACGTEVSQVQLMRAY